MRRSRGGSTWTRGFGCQHDLVASRGPLGQPCPDKRFGAPRRVGLGWDRIHFCRVDQIHPRCQGGIELRMGFYFGVLLAPGHGA